MEPSHNDAAVLPNEKPSHWREKRKEYTKEEMKDFWNKKKQLKKARQSVARKDVVAAQQAQWEQLTAEEQEAMRQRAIQVHEARRRAEEEQAEQAALRLASSSTPIVVFDLSFVNVMNDRDCRSTASQIKYSYSVLRRSGFLMKPHISSFDENHPVFGALAGFEGFKRFPVPMDPRGCVECFPEAHKHKRLVYLTADTDDVLSTVDADHVYIVGAFVDHNSQKGLTKETADKAGIRTARLPLVEHMAVGNLCKVLTINHVVEVLTTFLRTNCWVEAFKVLPTRRVNGKKKRSSDATPSVSGDSDGAEE